MAESPDGGAQRQAIGEAMLDRNLDEGDFRAIPISSAEVHSPRFERKLVWS